MKRKAQGRGKSSAKAARKQEPQPINGERLKAAVDWVVNEPSFGNLSVHGNTKWDVFGLIA